MESKEEGKRGKYNKYKEKISAEIGKSVPVITEELQHPIIFWEAEDESEGYIPLFNRSDMQFGGSEEKESTRC